MSKAEISINPSADRETRLGSDLVIDKYKPSDHWVTMVTHMYVSAEFSKCCIWPQRCLITSCPTVIDHITTDHIITVLNDHIITILIDVIIIDHIITFFIDQIITDIIDHTWLICSLIL